MPSLSHPQLLSNLPRLPIQPNRRSPAPSRAPPQNPPIALPAPPPRPQSLHSRFLSRKPPRKPLILILESLAILSLRHGIHPPQETAPHAAQWRLLNPNHLRQIHAHSNNQSSLPCRGTIHRALLRVQRATMPNCLTRKLCCWRVFRTNALSLFFLSRLFHILSLITTGLVRKLTSFAALCRFNKHHNFPLLPLS